MNSNFRTSLLVLVLSLSFISFGKSVSAADPVKDPTKCVSGDAYCLLSPLPLLQDPSKGQTIDAGITASSTTPEAYIKGLINLMIAAAGVIAVVRLMVAGFTYISVESINGKSSARQDINNALLALLLAIASFTILQTISPRFTDLVFSIENVGTTTALQQGQTCLTQLKPDGSCDNICSTELNARGQCDAPLVEGELGSAWPPDNLIRSDLLLAGITFNHVGNCKTIGEANCTSVTGLSDTIIEALKNLKATCKCTVRITGGTEYWLHSTGTQHRPHGRAVDLSLDPTLNNFLRTSPNSYKKPGDGKCSKGDEVYVYEGGIYVNEQIDGNDPHWHICF